ncbi:DUF1772 domain-containing protein [Paracoccus sp. M683]|uniref:anthrone oxygenase family protein n=1 Tax=Paracoccus sp. M683 TaxID=2594268 RepID=UPI0011803564|nr:anthrone oxygenase family protein [Paracoccus sp. M683]TRW95663.1 DUF1772 domain-containing protein [Paracoccus sp. M683]
MTRYALLPVALLALLLSGAIFGFFFAWVCSTMWGLDAADPTVAIAAMQAMNASVRNAVFFPAFFLTPIVLLIAALLAQKQQLRPASFAFGAAALVYLLGGLVLTMMVNVPMNEALAEVEIPDNFQAAREIWQAYSDPWQDWNIIRTVFSGFALLLTGFALMQLRHRAG